MIPQHLAPIAPPSCARCKQLFSACVCATTPAGAHDDLQAMPKPRTFVKRGGYMICSACSYAVQYCRCGDLPAADTPPEDGPAADSLAKRIQQCKESK